MSYLKSQRTKVLPQFTVKLLYVVISSVSIVERYADIIEDYLKIAAALHMVVVLICVISYPVHQFICKFFTADILSHCHSRRLINFET